MANYDIRPLQLRILKNLLAVDKVCKEHNLRYYIMAGTMLGAVRHKGFIPWDDDADVAFTRNQYEAFMKVAPRELPDTMELLEPDSYRGGKAFYDFTPRIIYKKVNAMRTARKCSIMRES